MSSPPCAGDTAVFADDASHHVWVDGFFPIGSIRIGTMQYTATNTLPAFFVSTAPIQFAHATIQMHKEADTRFLLGCCNSFPTPHPLPPHTHTTHTRAPTTHTHSLSLPLSYSLALRMTLGLVIQAPCQRTAPQMA